MKNQKLDKRIIAKRKVKEKDKNELRQGITEKLLEKYIPKNLISIKTRIDSQTQNRAAWNHD